MATNTGSSGDDTINGSTGADNLNGGAGADYLYGDAGSDRLNGGSGNDCLDGGSGSDILNGDSGNDTLIYRLCENTGAGDVYTGGSGIDTIQLVLTGNEWLNDTVQSELARYFAHLATVQRNAQGEVSNGSARDFTFDFGYSTSLTVQMMETLKVIVDGNEITDLDKPIVDILDPDTKVTGSVVEDGTTSASGAIKFFDLDVTDTHCVSITPPAGAIGSLNAVITDVATGDGQGMVGWTYTLDNAAAQYLDDGDVKTEEFVIKIKDDEGQYVTQIVKVTITGTNDAPVISVGAGDSAAESVAETNAPLTASDTLTVVDADLSDAVTASVQSVSTVGPTGGLTNGQLLAMLSVTAGSIAADAGAANNLAWSFNSGTQTFDYLDDGESLELTYTVRATDDSLVSDDQTVTITINGTNDAPVISVGAGDSAAESVAETNAPLTASDTLTVVDADLSDAVTASVQSVSTVGPTGGLTNGQLLAMLSVTAGSIAADAGAANNLAWSFNSGTQTFDYLDDGESLELTYTVRATDDSLVSDDQTVTITINGTNDAPVISVGAGDSAAESVAETNAPLTASDTLTVVDADLSDAVTASVQSVSTVGPTGGLTNGQLLAMLSVTAGSIAADAGAANNLAWSFNSGTQTFDYLDDGESLELTYTVRATDDSLVSDDQTVTITINGTNDAPVISVGAGDSAAESVAETNAPLTASDTLTVVDADLSDAVTASVQSVSTVGPTGGLTNGQLLAMLSVTAGSIAADAGAANNLAWSFNSGTQTFDYLDDGESLELTYTVRATDDSLVSDDQTVTITINGTDDRTAPTDIRLIVDSPLVDQSNMNNFSISGTLVATDADPGAFTYTLLSQSPTGGSAATFSITDDNLFNAGNLGQQQTYRLAIEATQAGDPAGMSYTEIFTIITGRNGPQGDSLSDPTVPIPGDDDVLFGGDGNDILLGGDGDDTLFGHASTTTSPGDTLQGGAGNDTLYGGSGLDAIDTGIGNDVVAINAIVGSGSDSTRVTLVGNGNDTGQDTVTGFDMAADTLRIVGTGVTNFVHGTDTAIGTAAAVNDGTAGSFTTLTGLIELNQTANNNWTDGGDVAVTFAAPLGAFTEASFEARLQYNLTGTSAANTITGGGLDDTLSGAGGNDILIGGAGNDILVGGAGNDTFRWANTSEGMDSLDFTLGNLDPGNGALSANADVLDLSDVLGGVGALVTAVNADDSATVDDYISFAVAGTTATLRVDSDGLGGGGPIALATFAVTLGTTASSLLGGLLDNNQIAV